MVILLFTFLKIINPIFSGSAPSFSKTDIFVGSHFIVGKISFSLLTDIPDETLKESIGIVSCLIFELKTKERVGVFLIFLVKTIEMICFIIIYFTYYYMYIFYERYIIIIIFISKYI